MQNEIISIMKNELFLNLSMVIFGELKEPKTNLFSKHTSWLTGYLNLSCDGNVKKTNAKCQFEISRDWITKMPAVVCNEPWVRNFNIDWHTYKDGNLCIRKRSKWPAFVEEVFANDGIRGLYYICGQLIIQHTRSLLYRHKRADELSLAEWPKEWAFDPHLENDYGKGTVSR